MLMVVYLVLNSTSHTLVMLSNYWLGYWSNSSTALSKMAEKLFNYGVYFGIGFGSCINTTNKWKRQFENKIYNSNYVRTNKAYSFYSPTYCSST